MQPSSAFTPMLAYDIETNGHDYIDPRFKIIMVCVANDKHARLWGRGDNIAAGIAYLKQQQTQGIELVGHNASMYDRACIKQVYGDNIKSGDTQFMAFLLDEQAGQRNTHGLRLENLAVKYLGVPPWKDAVTWDWKDTDNWSDDDERWQTMADYCMRDTSYTYKLARLLTPKLHEQGLWAVYSGLMLPASRALSNIYETGVALNEQNAVVCSIEQSDLAAKYLKNLQARRLQNPGSTKQLGVLLFDELKQQPTHFTPKGAPSTNELALKTIKMVTDEPEVETLVDEVLAYRTAKKTLNTYIEPYTALAENSPDGRIHPSYSLTYTVTGRTSAFSPNIQNIPRDKSVRSIIGASPGRLLLQADLSMVELRIAAHVFQEPAMLAAFARGDDLHYLMAEAITGKTREEITDEERTNAKITNFMFLYGAETSTFIDSTFKNYDKLFPYEVADVYRDTFFATWAGLIPAYNRVFAELLEHEFVTSATGRRRRFPGFRAASIREQAQWLREGVNFLVQSLASDVALAMLVQVTGMGFPITAYIHDAIHTEVEPDKVPYVGRAIKQAVEQVVPQIMESKFGLRLNVPIKVDISVGNSWGELQKVKGL